MFVFSHHPHLQLLMSNVQISHDHIAHHFFLQAPFCKFSSMAFSFFPEVDVFLTTDNGPKITEHVKAVMKDDYNYDSTVSFPFRTSTVIQYAKQNTFYALYRSFTECIFVEEEGNVIFYKNKSGKATREVEESALKEIKMAGWDPAKQDELNETKTKSE
jgi:hypothetical protein